MNDERVKYVPIGCGKCMECMKKKKREWQVRLLEEIRHDNTGKFITLTFDSKSLEYLTTKIKYPPENKDILDNELATNAVRYFLERWRKDNKKSVKHWFITERGHNGTERIHLHGILFTNKNKEYIEKKWLYGKIFIGNFVNEKTINYIIKYCTKLDKQHKEFIPKILTSAGIGKKYTERPDSNQNKFKDTETKEYYRTKQGHKLALPIYYRNKIYTEDEREKLWLNKLDKEERYVGGERVSVKNGEEEYFKLLKHYRAKNQRLGFGNDKSQWEKKEYQQQLNLLKHKELCQIKK